jgi:hypothetical protein
MVVCLISALNEKTYKGPVVHNKSLQDHIEGFKAPKNASDFELIKTNNWLMWQVLKAYPQCLATESQRWTELLQKMKNWSVNDSNKFPTDIFINDMREEAKSTIVKSLPDLITSISTWIETQIREVQASGNKVISVNVTRPSGGGCARHGPHAASTLPPHARTSRSKAGAQADQLSIRARTAMASSRKRSLMITA